MLCIVNYIARGLKILYFLLYMRQLLVGDDWEHEEIFTDDDEAVGNDPEEREDLAPEVPAPPEIKQVCYMQFLYLASWGVFMACFFFHFYVACKQKILKLGSKTFVLKTYLIDYLLTNIILYLRI